MRESVLCLYATFVFHFVLISVLVSYTICLSLTETWRLYEAYGIRGATHPDYPDKCYFEGPPVETLSIGQRKRLSKACVALACGEGFTLVATGCGGIYGTDIHCRVVRGDLSKPYPHCCDEIIC